MFEVDYVTYCTWVAVRVGCGYEMPFVCDDWFSHLFIIEQREGRNVAWTTGTTRDTIYRH
jgi:hypothetical protein